jgi:PilZ domain/GYF domain 2
MQHKYYVSHETQQMGPYSIDEIVSFVSGGTLSPLDYIYVEAKNDWILFLDYEELSEKVKALKPKAPPKIEEERHVEEPPKIKKASYNGREFPSDFSEPIKHEWFVLKGENKFGPFAYVDVVKMLQQGVVFEFDYAWHNGMDGWERLAEIKYFSKDSLSKLKESAMPEISEVFFRRRYKRVKYGGTILVHDNKKVWKGSGVEISEGGAGVVMENAMVLPGQELYLHFKPGDGVPPFNAVCEVVSKQFVSGVSSPSTPIMYGLKFKTISNETQKVLKEYTKKAS